MIFENVIKGFIQSHHLLKDDGKYLVALSGGADSVSLLMVLHDLGYCVEACHCNFHLRGAESDRDESFCAHLCQRLHIPFHTVHFYTHEYATLHKVSIEMAARELRYKYFEQLRHDIDADGICVAHHQDDSVETVLINLIRGTGIRGLKGISPKNGNILRPLLCIGREDILKYLKEKNQDFVTDSTNLVDDVTRNKIRLNVIPLLKEINPSVCDNIAATAEHVGEAYKMLESLPSLAVGQDGKSFAIRKLELMKQASPEFVLFTHLSPYGFTGSVIQQILDSIDVIGKTWQSTSHQLVIDREVIIVRELTQVNFHSIKIPETGSYVYRETDGSERKIKLGIKEKEKNFLPSKERHHVTLDADEVTFPLTLRATETGDRFVPYGMKGSKLVSDYLTDRKKNLFEKESQRVLVDAKGTILWLVGERTADKGKVSPTTQNILDIEMTKA